MSDSESKRYLSFEIRLNDIRYQESLVNKEIKKLVDKLESACVEQRKLLDLKRNLLEEIEALAVAF